CVELYECPAGGLALAGALEIECRRLGAEGVHLDRDRPRCNRGVLLAGLAMSHRDAWRGAAVRKTERPVDDLEVELVRRFGRVRTRRWIGGRLGRRRVGGDAEEHERDRAQQQE